MTALFAQLVIAVVASSALSPPQATDGIDDAPVAPELHARLRAAPRAAPDDVELQAWLHASPARPAERGTGWLVGGIVGGALVGGTSLASLGVAVTPKAPFTPAVLLGAPGLFLGGALGYALGASAARGRVRGKVGVVTLCIALAVATAVVPMVLARPGSNAQGLVDLGRL